MNFFFLNGQVAIKQKIIKFKNQKYINCIKYKNNYN